MNFENINMEDISQILSSLSDDDVEQLKNVAQSFFPGGGKEQPKEKKPPEKEGEKLDHEKNHEHSEPSEK